MERIIYLLIVCIVAIVLLVFLLRLVGGTDGDVRGVIEVARDFGDRVQMARAGVA